MRAKSAYRVVYSFGLAPDAAFPAGSLIDIRGTLYGTTLQGGATGGGTLFSVDASGKERVLASFPTYSASYGGPPAEPSALISLNGKLYGVTSFGGTGACTVNGVHIGCGTLFSYSPRGGMRTIYNFTTAQSEPVALTSANGLLYGATVSLIYSSTPAGKIHVLYRFRSPIPINALVAAGSTLYGTLAADNYANPPTNGAVFALTPPGKMRTIYRFKGGSDGQLPQGGLVFVDGALYGATRGGGTGKCVPYDGTSLIGCGTIYTVTPSGVERVLHSFNGISDGSFPRAGLTDAGGALYGTASGAVSPGGSTGAASIFRITTSGTLSVLHVWPGVEGESPDGSVVQMGSALFSTTYAGGKVRRGTVFSVTP